jgi:hypothetical protein
LTEVGVAGSITTLEHIHDGANKSVGVLHRFAITGNVECLEEKTKPCLDQDLIAVETNREAKFAFVEKLNNLNDVLAGIANSYDSRRTFVAEVGNDNGSVN